MSDFTTVYSDGQTFPFLTSTPNGRRIGRHEHRSNIVLAIVLFDGSRRHVVLRLLWQPLMGAFPEDGRALVRQAETCDISRRQHGRNVLARLPDHTPSSAARACSEHTLSCAR
jgi:hypothetical protein